MARSTRSNMAEVEGLNEVLKDLRGLPKEASKELRQASARIADRYMVPAWQQAALNSGPWGPKIAQSIRSKKDRIPTVIIGAAKPKFSGGGTPTSLRYPSEAGVKLSDSPSAIAAFNGGSGWMKNARVYVHAAMTEWGRAVDKICHDFNTGGRAD